MSANNAAYPKENVSTIRYAAAALAFASELIHLWVLPGQLVAAMPPGAFFFLVAVGQGLLGASLLFGGGRRTLRFGILLNLLVIFVWLFTRVVSVPELFEPLRLPVEGLGAVATAIEVALVVLLVRLRRSVPPKSASGAFGGVRVRRLQMSDVRPTSRRWRRCTGV